MALNHCPHCDTPTPAESEQCPQCGYSTTHAPTSPQNTDSIERTVRMYLVIGLVSAVLIVLTFLLLTYF